MLPQLGMMSSVAPCIIANGQTYYPGFPQWLGKNSTSRKARRLISELKHAFAHRISADKYAI